MAVKFAGKAKKIVAKKLTKKVEKVKSGTVTIDVEDGLVANAFLAKEALDKAKAGVEVLNQKVKETMKPLLDAAGDAKANQKVVLQDSEYILKLGEKARSTKITGTMEEIHELLGDEVFYGICKIGVGDLKKYLTQAELKNIISIEQKGVRSKKFLKNI